MADQWNVVSEKKADPWAVVSNKPAKTADIAVKEPTKGRLGDDIIDAGLNMVTGLVAKPVSDIAGLAAMGHDLITGDKSGDPQAFKNAVQRDMTYAPHSERGKNFAENNPLALVGKGVDYLGKGAGNVIAGDRSNPYRAGLGDAAHEAINQAPGLIAPAFKKPLTARLAGETDALAAAEKQNAARDAALVTARSYGYKFPPSVAKVKDPVSSAAQAGVGSTKMDYGASFENQPVTNKIVSKQLGLPPDEVISSQALAAIRKAAGKPYEDVKVAVPILKTTPKFQLDLQNPNSHFADAIKEFPEYFHDEKIAKLIDILSKKEFSSKAAIQLQKKLRQDGNTNMKAFDDTAKNGLGEAQLNAAKAIDELIDENLAMQAPPGVKNFTSKLSANLATARKKIAQTYAVEGALNDATGNVSAKHLAKLLDDGVPLDGGLKDVATTYKAFEKQMREVDKLPATANESLSNWDVTKGVTAAVTGHPVVGAAMLARPAIKPILLSDWYQALNVKPPIYQPGRSYTGPVNLANNPGMLAGIPKPPPQDNNQ